MRNNNFIWIFIFLIIGTILYFKDKPGGIKRTWDSVFSKTEKSKNPYKSPEPTSDNEASANNSASATDTQASASSPKKAENSSFDKILAVIKDKVIPSNEEPSDSDIPDWALPKKTRNEQVVNHGNYVLAYSEEHEQPKWVCHLLKGEYTRGVASRADKQFEPDGLVKTGSALSSDYSGSGYDRGHITPAGDFKCCQDKMDETFMMSNICPQNPDFNRGIWGNLEEKVRGWARRDGELIIVSGPILKVGLDKIGRYNKVSVPEEFYKIIVYRSGSEQRAIGFILENKPLFGSIIYDFVVSIDEIERRTGIDFFETLPDNEEAALESQADYKVWSGRRK